MKTLVFIVLLLALSSRISLIRKTGVDAQEAYEYYGYIPEFFNYTYPLDLPLPSPTPEDQNPGHHYNGTAHLDIIGYEDGTSIAIYNIASPENQKLLVKGTVNRMGLYSYRLPKDYYFKVVSDKPIAVGIGGGTMYDGAGSYYAGLTAFYPSIDGGFAGKEFIFMAFPSQLEDQPEPMYHAVHAVEDAHVTIYDFSGRVVWEKDLAANSSRVGIILPPRLVYRVVSTGRIMVANWVGHTWTVLPNAFGGYSGTRFYTREGALQWVALMVIGQSNSTAVKVLDPVGSKSFGESTVEPRRMWYAIEPDLPFKKQNTVITSTAPVMVFVGDVDPIGAEAGSILSMRDSVTFFGVRANEPTTFYIISKGIIFSPEANARVTIGALVIDIKKGGYVTLPSGLVTLTANTTLIIEGISEGSRSERGYSTNFGAFLITPKTVNMVYPPPKIKEQGLPLTQIAAVVIVAAVVVTLLVWKKPWKSR